MTEATLVNRKGREWSDWAGCVSMLAFTAYLMRGMSTTGILLLPTILHNFILAWAFLLRRSAKAKLTSFPARIAAYGTTILFPAYIALAQAWFPRVLASTRQSYLRESGAVLWLIGCVFGLWGVWALRYSFSIEPQARRLVVKGPYRFARHPIYAAYVLQYAGIFFMHDSRSLGIVLMIWMVLVWFRIGYEETTLLQVFPEYRTYQQQVGPLWPGFPRKIKPETLLRAAKVS